MRFQNSPFQLRNIVTLIIETRGLQHSFDDKNPVLYTFIAAHCFCFIFVFQMNGLYQNSTLSKKFKYCLLSSIRYRTVYDRDLDLAPIEPSSSLIIIVHKATAEILRFSGSLFLLI